MTPKPTSLFCGNGHERAIHGFWSGGQQRCRVCYREYAARQRARTREAQVKVCACCKRRLPLDHTGPLRCSETCAELVRARGRASAKRRRAANPEKLRQATADWKAKNPDAVRAMVKRWKVENKEHVREYQQEWQRANPERVREFGRINYARHREEGKERTRQWRLKNPEHARALRSAYRARQLRAPGAHSHVEWLARCAQFQHRCFYCDAEAVLTADHLIALSAGGSNDIENVVPACLSCNASKQDTEVRLWLARRLREGLPLSLYARALLASAAEVTIQEAA
jgi:hypothetical protein